ncbi:hypothetical protein HDV06_005716 [Boothiomyces sp. JEL0866]|nr:hypothetical protein HDV06_005716 [Boothiomyces sp. JEL0866]
MKFAILSAAFALVAASPMPQAAPQNCNDQCHKMFPFGNQLGRLIQCQNVCSACAQHCVQLFPFGNQLGEQNQCIAQCTPQFVLPTTTVAAPATTAPPPPVPTAVTVFASCDDKCAKQFPFDSLIRLNSIGRLLDHLKFGYKVRMISTGDAPLQLYTYWKSSCSWRVRIALFHKGIAYESIPVNLSKGKQQNPNGTVPSLVFPNGETIIQSSAILEILEEIYPQKPLLPSDPFERATVRSICSLIGADIQPLQKNPQVGPYFAKKEGLGLYFINLGFEALEIMLQKSSGVYSAGNELTLADVFVAPQVYNAIRYGMDMSKFPVLHSVYTRLMELEAFKNTRPLKQPDAE